MTTPTISLSSLDIDKEFLIRANKLGISTIDDIMNVNLPILRKNEDFNYLWYFELLQLLESKGLLEEFEKRHL